MKHQPLRLTIFSMALVCLIICFGHQSIQAKENWIAVRSKNFTLVGNASEKDIRLIANRLEQFRAAFGSLFPATPLKSSVPTCVIVFKNDLAFKPYKANAEQAGYFQPGEEVNYIALTSDGAATTDSFRVIFHEYVHLLVSNSMGAKLPLWFNEGLAEYYSTFELATDDRRVLLANQVTSRTLIGRHTLDQPRIDFMPLRTLFAVDYKSPYYNESDKMNAFYTEAWMFTHYLIQADGGRRRPQVAKFVELVGSGSKIEDAFQQAFQNSIEAVEKDFKTYIQAGKYMDTRIAFEQKTDFSSAMQVTPLSEADAHAYLGDLLAHTQRVQQAETELQQALALDPESSLAQGVLGMMLVRQGRMDDARPHLEKALKPSSENYLLHYYYAYALSELNMNEHRIVVNYSAEAAATMRAALNKAIALRPDYAESYWLLGFVNLVRNEQIDESIGLLKQALTVTTTNQRVSFLLAQLYLRKEMFAEARQLLTPIAQTSTDSDLREQASRLGVAITRAEEQRVKIQDELKQQAPVGISKQRAASQMTLASAPLEEDMNAALADALRVPREGEQRVQGFLTDIDCNTKGITFQVRAGNQLLKFHSDDFEHVVITTFTTGVGREVACGPRKPENAIVLTYTASNATMKSDGEVRAIEFVPQTFVLKR